jgi:hypothetical protein
MLDLDALERFAFQGPLVGAVNMLKAEIETLKKNWRQSAPRVRPTTPGWKCW